MKKQFLTAFLITVATAAFAVSNLGIDYFKLGEFDQAKAYFEKQLAQSPAESNYYLGEMAFANGKIDEAKAYYEKGLAADPLYMLNNIGKAKVMMKTDRTNADLLIATTMKKNKKNVELNVAVARAYYENGIKDVAQTKLLLAKKVGKNSPLVYLYEGDILQDDNKPGDAAAKYEQAMYFDPESALAKLKYAVVYEKVNPDVSVETLKKVIAAKPEYLIAYKYLGRSYQKSGKYNSAVESYNTYFTDGQFKEKDMEYLISLAQSYYFTDQFQQSIDVLDKGLAMEPNNFVLNRLRMYNASKVNDKENGLALAEKFFKLSTTGSDRFIYQDYSAYASILGDAGKYQESIDLYNKVLNTEGIEVNKTDIYKEMAPLYTKKGEPLMAAELYKKIIDLAGFDATATDYYQMGRTYYTAALSNRADTTVAGKAKFKEIAIKADSAFSKVCQMTPDSYIGYLWRGNLNSALDPTTALGLAKPHYEATIEILLKKIGEGSTNGYTKDLLRCYEYLGVYYFQKDDKVNSTKYWTKVLELDPNNANGKAILEEYKNAASAKK